MSDVRRVAVLLLALAGCGFAESAGADAFRAWTSASGAKIEAAFVALEQDTVVLRDRNDRMLRIGLPQLSEPDRAFAREQADRVAAPAEPNKLPVFRAGLGQGLHALYEHAHFDAEMDENGVIRVFLKQDGQRVGPAFRFAQILYYFPTGEAPRDCPIIAFSNPPPPSLQPKQIALAGAMADGVRFAVTYGFQGNTISAFARGWDSRDRAASASVVRLMCRFDPSHHIDRGVDQAAREKLLQGCVVRTEQKVRGGNWKEAEFPYWITPDFEDARWMEAVGPWGPRRVRISAEAAPRGGFRGWTYPGTELWKGFSYFYAIWAKKTELSTFKDTIVLSVE